MPTVVRDAIWGDIELGERELALIDTPAFQRLRRVRQLGFADLVFPGAHHTRFEHSLGVFHLAGVLLARLQRATEVDASDGRAFLAAALLHDIGHYPFSHAVEELEMDQIRPHTEIARDLVTSGDVGAVLRERWDVDPSLVAALVAGPGTDGAALTPVQELLRTAIDSGVDVDKLDYLVRDARAANVPYGLVDVQRLVASLTVWHDADGRPRIAIEEKGVAALESLVFAKHLMFATVYWHHACRAAVAMLLRAIQEALLAGTLSSTALQDADDASLVAFLRSETTPQPARELAERIRARRLYKRSVEVGVSDGRFDALESLWYRPGVRRDVEDGWARAVGGSPGSVLLDIPEPRRILVDVPVLVDEDGVREWDTVSALALADLDRVQTRVRKIRVFASSRGLAQAVARLEPSPY